jgi:hypothetical protein
VRRRPKDRSRRQALALRDVVFDRITILICSGSAEDEQARSLGIIVMHGARWEPGGGTPRFDIALSHDGTDGGSTALLDLMVQAVK